MTNKIVFHSKRKENIGNEHVPQSSKNNMPKWFLDKDKYKKNKNGLYQLSFGSHRGKQIVEKTLSWKACPAILDVAISGYLLKTPVDINISKSGGKYEILNKKECGFFCDIRGEEDGFPTPYGYEDIHFVWITNWMPQVPEGYTTLWTHPFNRFDLPFISINGFVDSESYTQRGRMPFFIKKDFEGVIPAGTPFIQVIPIKNESWQMELKNYTEDEINENNHLEEKTLSSVKDDEDYVPGTLFRTNYKNRFWLKKQYD